MHFCSFCSARYISQAKLFNHLITVHEHEPNFKIYCEEDGKYFTRISSYKYHFRKCHKIKKSNNNVLKCPYCVHESTNLNLLISHYNQHINLNEIVSCPIQDCSKSYSIYSSLRSHVSRYHSGSCELKDVILKNSDQNSFSLASTDDNNDTATNTASVSSIANSFSGDENISYKDIEYKSALLLLKLLARYNLCTAGLQDVVQGIYGLGSLFSSCFESAILKILGKHNVNIDEALKEVVSYFDIDNSSFLTNLGTNFKRMKYFKDNFGLVEPQEIYLGKNSKRQDRSFQYIPILDNLRQILKHDDVCRQIFTLPQQSPGIYSDFTDGLFYKENVIFKIVDINSPPLSLILYFDEFEIVNPIGAFRKKHKISAFYYMIGNLNPGNRSNIYVVQLAILCHTSDVKFFGLDIILKPLISDLNILATTGIDVPNVSIFKGGVTFVSADNLGSNFLGCFSESFSPKVNHICRSCMIDQDDLRTQFNSSKFVLRTVEQYENQIDNIEKENLPLSTYGIKSRSVLEKIPNFHTVKGLPPRCYA